MIAISSPNADMAAEVVAELHRIGETLLAERADLAVQLVQRIFDLEPAYQAGRTVSVKDLTDTVLANMTEIYGAIAGRPPGHSEFESNGRRRASSGVPLHAILHAYRIGGVFHWENFVRLAETTSHANRVIIEGTGMVWQIIEVASERVTTGYRDAVEDPRRQSLSERTALIDMVLSGAFSDNTDVWDAAAALHLPVEGDFVVVAAEAPRPGVEVLEDAELLFNALRSRSVWRTEPTAHVGLVSLATGVGVGRAVETLDAAASGPIGVSVLFHDLRHAPEGLRQARVACAAGKGLSARATTFASVPIQALLVLAPNRAEEIRQAVLGPVLDLPAVERRLHLDTLRAWAEAGGSTTECAKRMYVHRNSVSRRLQRIHDLTGRDPQTPNGMAELYIAMEAERLGTDPDPL